MPSRTLILSSLLFLVCQNCIAATPSPIDYIRSASNAMLATSSIDSDKGRFTALDEVIQEYFDLDLVTQAVLGQYANDLTEDQLARFAFEFRTGLVDLIATALNEIDEYEIDIGEARMRSDDRAQVPVNVDAGSLGDFEFQFSLAFTIDRWNALNLIVNGVNIGLTYRNQFSELMASNNADVETVLTMWRETIAQNNVEE